MKLFIDVNGTITSEARKDGVSGLDGQSLKDGVDEFFDWATQSFDCYWLSNLVPRGMSLVFRKTVLPYLPESAKLVKPAFFTQFKTEAIKDGDFLWIDDSLLQEEEKYLNERGWLDGYIRVDKNATSMAPVMAEIKKRMHRQNPPEVK